MHIQVRGESHSTKVFSYKSAMTQERTEFYPENGLITVEGERRDGEAYYERVARREFLLRASAISEEISVLRSQGKVGYANDLLRLLDVMVLVARAAKEQGDPFSRKHTAQMANERQRTSILLPGMPGFATPAPPMPMSPQPKTEFSSADLL